MRPHVTLSSAHSVRLSSGWKRRIGRIGLSSDLCCTRGVSLVEVMVAFGLFAILATGIAATLITTRKAAESDIYQAEAQTVAQTIMEQVMLIPYNTLSIATSPPPVELRFMAATSTGNTEVQTFALAWAANDTTYTPVGEVQGGVTQGILLDVDYINSGQKLRQKRYMDFRVNLRKDVDNSSGKVAVILNYRWAVPDRRNSSGGRVYITKQIRTVRSETSSY